MNTSNVLFDQVYKFYSSELVYSKEYMPKEDNPNQVYFPYCKYTLDMDGLLSWFHAQEQVVCFQDMVADCLFNKDKEAFHKEVSQQPTQPQEVPMNVNTLFPNFNPGNMLNVWWGLPTSVQDKVKQLVPDKDTWTLNMSKDKSGVWVFSLPQFMTFNESMCNGTEEVMDYWYEKKFGTVPVTGSKMKVTVSKVQPSSFDTKVTWMYEDPMWTDANYYYDNGSGMDVWLCPYVQVLFKEVPQGMWLVFEHTK